VGSDGVDATAIAAGKPEIVTEAARKYLEIRARVPQKKSEMVSYFSSQKTRLFFHDVYHAIHHKFTTTYQMLHHEIRKNPCKNALAPHNKKRR
jgi:hypothetical protein